MILERGVSPERHKRKHVLPIRRLNKPFIKRSHLWIQDSIISQAISLSRWLRWVLNSGSGQCKSLIKDWRASSFQNKSSDVAQPLLLRTKIDKISHIQNLFPQLESITPPPKSIKVRLSLALIYQPTEYKCYIALPFVWWFKLQQCLLQIFLSLDYWKVVRRCVAIYLVLK